MEETAYFEKKFDFDDFSVEMNNRSLIYKKKHPIYGMLYTHVDNLKNSVYPIVPGEKYGDMIEIYFVDAFGNSMKFAYLEQAWVKDMFVFIGKGFNVFEILDKAEGVAPKDIKE